MQSEILALTTSPETRVLLASAAPRQALTVTSDEARALTLLSEHPETAVVVLDMAAAPEACARVLRYLDKTCSAFRRTLALLPRPAGDTEDPELPDGIDDFLFLSTGTADEQAAVQLRVRIRHQRMLADRHRDRDRLSVPDNLCRSVFDQAPIGIAVGHRYRLLPCLSDGRSGINDMFTRITGWSREELSRRFWTDITHPDDRKRDMERFQQFASGQIQGYSMEKRYVRPDGSSVWVHMTVTPIMSQGERSPYHLCLIEDISSRYATEQELEDTRRSQDVLLASLPGLAYRCRLDHDWTMEFVSQGSYDLTGYRAEDLLYNRKVSYKQLIAPEHRDLLWEEWQRRLAEGSRFRQEYEIVRADGQRRWVLETGQAVRDEDGGVRCLEGIVLDISEQKEQEQQLQYLHAHDPLTGLSNRAQFEVFLEQESESRRRRNSAVLLLRLKRFDLLNQVYGYRYSEELIRTLTRDLPGALWPDARIFHIATDRYAVHVRLYRDRAALAELAQALLHAVREHLRDGTVGCSIGIAEIGTGRFDPERLLRNATIAAESGEETERFGFTFFDAKMEALVQREAAIERELMQETLHADAGNLNLLFQPIQDLKTDRIYGFEALARFVSPTLGVVSPGEFIPIAERTQLIVALGRKISYLALLFLARLRREGFTDVTVSVNVSAIQLLRDDFLPDLEDLARRADTGLAGLTLEITETVLVSDDRDLNHRLTAIRDRGMRVAIDDFGTGSSSLARERDLNVDVLKIDRSFITRLGRIRPDEAITGDIISMAHKMGHLVVAEGVETPAQRRYLVDHGCDLLQGYLFSRPVPPQAALTLLQETGGRT